MLRPLHRSSSRRGGSTHRAGLGSTSGARGTEGSATLQTFPRSDSRQPNIYTMLLPSIPWPLKCTLGVQVVQLCDLCLCVTNESACFEGGVDQKQSPVFTQSPVSATLAHGSSACLSSLKSLPTFSCSIFNPMDRCSLPRWSSARDSPSSVYAFSTSFTAVLAVSALSLKYVCENEEGEMGISLSFDV